MTEANLLSARVLRILAQSVDTLDALGQQYLGDYLRQPAKGKAPLAYFDGVISIPTIEESAGPVVEVGVEFHEDRHYALVGL